MTFFDPSGQPLRAWVLITGMAGLGAAIGAYRNPLSPHKTLYRRTPHTANPSFARMYATWLLTSTAIRIAFFLAPDCSPSNPIYWVAFSTYLIALFHFVLELFVFKAASLIPGGVMPCIVASFSIVWMLAAAMLS